MSDVARSSDDKPGEQGRSLPEWVTFVVSCLVVGSIAVLMIAESFGSSDPAAPVAEQSGPTVEANGHFFVNVDVTNHGDETAAEVQVLAELTIAGEVASGDQVIDFLAGDEVEHLVFSFDSDPVDGAFVVRVTGFSEP